MIRILATKRRKVIAALCVAVLLVAAGITALILKPRSQDDIAADCVKVLNSKSSEAHRPAACKGLTDDNYAMVLISWKAEKAGFIDKDGNAVDLSPYLDAP